MLARGGRTPEWFSENGDEIRQAMFLSLIATLPIVWWGAAIYRALEPATGNARLGIIAMVGIALATATAAVASAVFATVAIVEVDGAGGADGVRFFYVLGTSINAGVGIGTALVVGAVSVGILRTGMMPRVLGWFGLLVAALAVLGSAVAVSTRDIVFTLSLLSFLAFALWLIAVSVLMLRRPVVPPPAQ